jgi:hypothetical protein
MHHRFGRGVVGLVAGLAAICLLSLPAAANTKNLAFVNVTGTTPGSITFYNSDEELVTSVAVPSPPGMTCSTEPTTSTNITATLTSSTPSTIGTIAITFTSLCITFGSGTTSWCFYIGMTITGTYTATKTYTSTSSNTTVLKKNTGPTPVCHAVNTAPWCTLSVTGWPVSGIITSTNALPTLNNSDTFTIAGTSAVGSLIASGTATTCGLFIAANNGYVGINGKLHVVH